MLIRIRTPIQLSSKLPFGNIYHKSLPQNQIPFCPSHRRPKCPKSINSSLEPVHFMQYCVHLMYTSSCDSNCCVNTRIYFSFVILATNNSKQPSLCYFTKMDWIKKLNTFCNNIYFLLLLLFCYYCYRIEELVFFQSAFSLLYVEYDG